MPPPLNDPVSQHMHRNLTRLRADQTVHDALESLRANPPQGRILYFYVVDPDEHLVGVVPARRLIIAQPETSVADLMIRQVVTLPHDASVLDACEFFILHRFLALPVVDEQRRLVGVVDVELYLDEDTQLDEQSRLGDLFQLIGVHALSMRSASSFEAVRQRFPWLLCNIAGGLLAAFLTGLFEAELKKAVALALFIPIVLALAESVAIQSVSLALERLHKGQVSLSRLLNDLSRELITGLGLGLLCSALVVVVAFIWLRQTEVALCLLGGITGGVTAAALIGLATPGALRLWAREPRVAAGPIALACTDMATLGIYFTLARLLIG